MGADVIEVRLTPKRAAERPQTLDPVLIVRADNNALVMQEEIFGPLLPARTYRSFEEVIHYINASPPHSRFTISAMRIPTAILACRKN